MNAFTAGLLARPQERADDRIVSSARLDHFVGQFEQLLYTTRHRHAILASGAGLLRHLVERDDWLPDSFAISGAHRHRQHLLHSDARARFSVASFVLAPGLSVPVSEDGPWGLVGILRGAQLIRAASDDARLPWEPAKFRRLDAGAVDLLGPHAAAPEQVTNAFDDRVTIAIHLFGPAIGAGPA